MTNRQPLASASHLLTESKEMVKSFTDLANLAKVLMDENHQPSVQQELKKIVPQYKRWT